MLAEFSASEEFSAFWEFSASLNFGARAGLDFGRNIVCLPTGKIDKRIKWHGKAPTFQSRQGLSRCYQTVTTSTM